MSELATTNTRHTAAEMQRHREIQRRSGLSIEAYCKREKLSPSNWWYWRKRLIREKRTVRNISPIPFLHIPPSPPEPRLELTLPNGSRITVSGSTDPAVVRQYVRLLSGLRPR